MKIKKFLFVITTMFLMVQGASAWNGSGTFDGETYHLGTVSLSYNPSKATLFYMIFPILSPKKKYYPKQ